MTLKRANSKGNTLDAGLVNNKPTQSYTPKQTIHQVPMIYTHIHTLCWTQFTQPQITHIHTHTDENRNQLTTIIFVSPHVTL